MSNLALEAFGTFASVIIAISLTMKNLKRLRWFNLVGSVFFALYGLGLKSMPVFLVNAFIVGIDAWYIVKMNRSRTDFSLLHAGSGDSEYLKAFLAYYKADIARYAPSFPGESGGDFEAVFVLRDMVPASLVLYRKRGEGVFDLLLDYAAPPYRDYKNAEFFFSAVARDLVKSGEARFYERSETQKHVSYLKKMGFLPAGEPQNLPGKGKEYVKTVRL
jgi:hypothetical protein